MTKKFTREEWQQYSDSLEEYAVLKYDNDRTNLKWHSPEQLLDLFQSFEDRISQNIIENSYRQKAIVEIEKELKGYNERLYTLSSVMISNEEFKHELKQQNIKINDLTKDLFKSKICIEALVSRIESLENQQKSLYARIIELRAHMSLTYGLVTTSEDIRYQAEKTIPSLTDIDVGEMIRQTEKKRQDDVETMAKDLSLMKPIDIPIEIYPDFIIYCEKRGIDGSSDPMKISHVYMDYLKHLIDLDIDCDNSDFIEEFLEKYKDYKKIKDNSEKPKRNFEILFANDEVALVKIFTKEKSIEDGNQVYYHTDIALTNKQHTEQMCIQCMECTLKEFNEALKEFNNNQLKKYFTPIEKNHICEEEENEAK
jgi:hypothetical protein